MTKVQLIESNDTGNKTIAACCKINWESNLRILNLLKQVPDSKPVAYKVSVRTNE